MNIFDAIIIGITLILAIKGYFNGIIKELGGLIGIIGGLFLASKFYHQAGVYINGNLLEIPNKSAIDLIGFISVFVGFWVAVVFIGFLISKILTASALGGLDKLLGFLFGGIKFFLLISVIVSLLWQVAFIKEELKEFTKKSIVMPILIKTGEKIINLTPNDIKNISKNVKIPH
ncbi:MAG TPA: CvpA family protein [Nautiliaceae bacterium]|nr:CvpA family protein [Nautiliaceae bacterium]